MKMAEPPADTEIPARIATAEDKVNGGSPSEPALLPEPPSASADAAETEGRPPPRKDADPRQSRERNITKRWVLSLFMLAIIASLTLGAVYWLQAVEEPPAPIPAATPVPVEVIRVAPGPFTHYLQALGTVRANREAALSVKVSGPVARVPEGIELGASVRRGTLLAEIDPAPFRIEVQFREALLARAEAEHRRAEAVIQRQNTLIEINRDKLRLARAEWNRLKGLFKRKLTTQQDMERSELLVRRGQEELERAQNALEETKGQRGIAAANVAAAAAELSRARLTLKDTRVLAPFAGVIAEKVVTAGEMVKPGTILFRLVDHDVARIRIRAPAADIRLLHPGLSASVRVEGFGEAFRGRVAYVGPRADDRTRTFPIEVLVANRGPRQLLPGMFARVRVPLETYPSAILIPRGSVAGGGKNRFVFLIDPKRNIARRRPIRIAREFGPRLLVRGGLRPGDLLVATGRRLLEDGAKVRIVAERRGRIPASGDRPLGP